MPNGYTVLKDGSLIIERWVGEVPQAEVILHEREQLQDLEIARGAVCLVDAREATFPDVAEEGLRELAALHGDPGNATSISRYALVMSMGEFEKARILEVLLRKFGVNIIVFMTLEAACLWSGTPPVRAPKIFWKIPLNPPPRGV